jgi:hypothetical protein
MPLARVGVSVPDDAPSPDHAATPASAESQFLRLSPVGQASLALRFLLELAALAAVGYWGVTTGQGLLQQVALGLGAPLVFAAVWGVFVSPKAPRRLAGVSRLGLELVLFGAAAGALWVAGHPALAAGFTLAVLASETATLVLDQR